MTDVEAIYSLRIDATRHIDPMHNEYTIAISAIETLAKARALLSAYAEFRFSAVIDDNTDKLVDGLYGLVEGKP